MNTIVTSKMEILAAARKLASEEGMGALNMRAIAQTCGIAVGSVYHYFPSKTELMIALTQEMWKTIFHEQGQETQTNFIKAVEMLFDRARAGAAEYPSFFTAHPTAFVAGDKGKGRAVMEQYFDHIKAGLLHVLLADSAVYVKAFSDDFTREDLIAFTFSNVLYSLENGESSCITLLKIVGRILYE